MSPNAIFEATDYKIFVRDFIKDKPSGGRGIFRDLANHLRVHTTFISQVFRGDKNKQNSFIYYLDTSAKVKFYIKETGADELCERFNSDWQEFSIIDFRPEAMRLR